MVRILKYLENYLADDVTLVNFYEGFVVGVYLKYRLPCFYRLGFFRLKIKDHPAYTNYPKAWHRQETLLYLYFYTESPYNFENLPFE